MPASFGRRVKSPSPGGCGEGLGERGGQTNGELRGHCLPGCGHRQGASPGGSGIEPDAGANVDAPLARPAPALETRPVEAIEGVPCLAQITAAVDASLQQVRHLLLLSEPCPSWLISLSLTGARLHGNPRHIGALEDGGGVRGPCFSQLDEARASFEGVPHRGLCTSIGGVEFSGICGDQPRWASEATKSLRACESTISMQPRRRAIRPLSWRSPRVWVTVSR